MPARPFFSLRCLVVGAAAATLLAASAVPARAAQGDCSLPVNSDVPKSSDCLFILRTAVQARECALCTCDVNSSGTITATDALLCLRFAVGQDVTLTCPECAFGCPGSIEIETHAGYGGECSTNGDCDVGACDAASGRCQTASELDLGWTGRAHNIDLDEGTLLRLDVACGDGTSGGCGQCTVDGVDPSLGNCRCGNDIRTVCDSPFEADATACPACNGGAFAGQRCSGDAQCIGGPCDAHCAFDPELVCTTNSDCPNGRKKCDATRRCGSGEGAACNVDQDCVGSCTAASTCECYDSPPIPVASVQFPFCILPKLASDVTGMVNVDTGDIAIVKNLRLLTYGGGTLQSPCPVCGGTCNANHNIECSTNDDCAAGDECEVDPTPNDGVREGICIGGANDGEACDVMAFNTSFPARTDEPGGGGYSLDCAPDAEESFSGSGLAVRVVETTGTSVLTSNVNCGENFPTGAECPCLMCTGDSNQLCNNDDDCASIRICSGNASLGCTDNADCQDINVGTCTTFGNTRCSGSFTTVCTTNADCVAADFGICDSATCSSSGAGDFPRPNACKDELCNDTGGGEGVCATGPDELFCDALVRADGTGIRLCLNNADCSAAVIGIDAGNCTLVQRRSCFVDPVVGSGDPDPSEPVTTAAFCVPPTTGAGQNASIGLPGPARILRQTTLTSFCASDPALPYQPGTGSCGD